MKTESIASSTEVSLIFHIADTLVGPHQSVVSRFLVPQIGYKSKTWFNSVPLYGDP